MHIIDKSRVDCVLSETAQLGECPVWHAEESCLYWTDIDGKTFNKFDPSSGQNTAIEVAERFGSFALREKGGFVVATENGFKLFDAKSNSLTAIDDPEGNKPNNRFNDGRCDRAGRFWAGTMVEKGEQVPDGGLYRLGADQSCHKMVEDIILANSLAWSPDNNTMYFSDTRAPMVWAYDFDLASGDISNQRNFIEFGEGDGVPDGAAVDSEGCFWLAQPRAWRICRYTPTGELDTLIHLPVSKPTMCAFGGPDLKTLYITSISTGLTAEELAPQPLAGGLFAIELDTQGLAEPKYAG
ncbi:MAG: SMP-30/gluconolactonase/LRE family protein [Rhodospirillaceae bacterium]|jgi:L-arabinonolactonase|nr:SMP-30/gluconolactonase/LRE family protein [Rhodospirillaceae bacterium]MBT4588793.1 SMP-30/gluconolactonase/LRE family protein [Rhodospirillaceae bacterium]MBT4940023.1 SMP-30/gluconolactonase/LRE family protein [Rhodospirillaceae bacterium]MBT5941114.1 SMP-30/gluconolactonase/LRE family protein [Rhodospirillaceae bacterium]MBT7266363.1 SMP-30/gluconolactonase/LRE family protein [Rhodospirillaceae bacterium]